MKIASSDLFDLIKRLRNKDIDKFVRHETEALQQVKLLDVLRNQKEYSESEALKQFDGKLQPSQLSTLKYELYNKLIDFLRFNDQHKNDSQRVFSYLGRAKVLKDRGLHVQAKKQLDKASKLCEKANLISEDLLVIDAKRELSIVTSDLDGKSELVDVLSKKALDNLAELQDWMKMLELYDLLFMAGKSRFIDMKNKEIKGYVKTLQNIDPSSFGVRTSILFNQTLAMGFMKMNEPQKVKTHLTEVCRLYESNKIVFENNIDDYIKVRINILSAEVLNKSTDYRLELSEVLKLVKKSYKKNPSYNLLHKEIRLYVLLSMYYVINGAYKEGLETVLLAEKIAEKNDLFILALDRAILNFMKFRSYFGLADYSSALIYVNKILDAGNKVVRPDIINLARVAFLIVQYELGNYEELNHYLNSARRYYSKRNEFVKVESLTIKLLRSLINDKSDHLKSISTFQSNLKEMKNTNLESVLFLYFDFDKWIGQVLASRKNR